MKTNKKLFIGKKSLATFLFITLLSMISCAKTSTKNDLLEQNLKGNVKSIRERFYQATEKFGEIVKEERKDESGFIEDSYHLFNASGNFSEEYFYSSDGSLNSKKTYQYDDQQKLIEQCSYNSDGELYSKEIYKYNDNKNISHKEFYNQSGLLVNKEILLYDERGNHIESKTYDADENLISKHIYEYDKLDRRIKTNEYEDKKLNSKISHQYDLNGNKVYEKFEHLGVTFKVGYEYDDKGNITKSKNYNGEETVVWEINYKYFFDKNFNWIKKIQFQKDIPQCIIEREIEYYK